MSRFRISNPLIAIGGSQFALSLMQTIFMFYYVKVYLNVFHVSQWWFNVAQGLFMIWNAVNDPLFGYMQDTHPGWLKSRTRVIKFFAPFLCASFVFMWYPWNTEGSWLEGLHLILSLFLYDAFFSMMGVAWSALFADSTRDSRTRVAAMKYSQCAILLSINGIAVMEKASVSLEHFTSFQLLSILFSIVALGCLWMAGSLQSTLPFVRQRSRTPSGMDRDNSKSLLMDGEGDRTDESDSRTVSDHPEQSAGLAHFMQLARQLLVQRDFVVIVITNFIHIMRSVAHMNFASISTEVLIPQSILPKGSTELSLFYALCTLGPQILIILSERIVVRVGAARILLFSYLCSVISSIALWAFHRNPYALMVFMFIDAITVHSSSPLFNIIFSDFIDEDCRRHNRSSSISSFVFSINALFTKPAQSVAPVIVVYILNLYGYQDFLLSKSASASLQSAMMAVLFSTPLILGAAQLLVFKYYSLLNKPTKELIM